MSIPKIIVVGNISSISADPKFEVTIAGTVTSGPADAIGRRVVFHLPDESLTSLLVELVHREPEMFQRIADAIDDADLKEDLSDSLNKQLSWSRVGGHARDRSIRHAIMRGRASADPV
jgi:hypothetical protein